MLRFSKILTFLGQLSLALATSNGDSQLWPRKTITNDTVDKIADSTDGNSTITIIDRCRAQELSPGAALGIIVVLATGSVLHLPGSMLQFDGAGRTRSSAFRLAPEFGLLELIIVISSIADATIIRGRSLRTAVTAVLTKRRQNITSRYQHDIHPDPYHDLMRWDPHLFDSLEEHIADPFVKRLQRPGISRVLGDCLIFLAFLKSIAVKGTLRTNVLAACYFAPIFILELLGLAAVRLDPRPRTREEAEKEFDEINGLALAMTQYTERAHRDWLMLAVMGSTSAIFGLPAVMLVFWPVGMAGFIFADFKAKHWSNGRWFASWSIWLEWFFYLSAAVALVAGVLYIPWLVMKKQEDWRQRYKERIETAIESVGSLFDFWTIWAVVRFAVLVKFYTTEYTGANTIKPAWLDWLG